jgi:hypothetical protein
MFKEDEAAFIPSQHRIERYKEVFKERQLQQKKISNYKPKYVPGIREVNCEDLFLDPNFKKGNIPDGFN